MSQRQTTDNFISRRLQHRAKKPIINNESIPQRRKCVIVSKVTIFYLSWSRDFMVDEKGLMQGSVVSHTLMIKMGFKAKIWPCRSCMIHRLILWDVIRRCYTAHNRDDPLSNILIYIFSDFSGPSHRTIARKVFKILSSMAANICSIRRFYV